jgi:hypothetical protein
MCMESVDGQDNPYVFTSKVHYYIMGEHLLCTNYIDNSYWSWEFKTISQLSI